MTAITQLSQLDLDATYSYADYLTHQRISRKLLRRIDNYLDGKRCEIFNAPFDVSLYNSRKSQLANREIFSVVQPDLCVICDSDKLTTQGCSGAPDWIIEILSPGNTKKEMHLKYDLYQENGVKEYWLVYPYEQAVYQFVLNAETNLYQLFAMQAGDDIATPYLFADLNIDLADVFAE